MMAKKIKNKWILEYSKDVPNGGRIDFINQNKKARYNEKVIYWDNKHITVFYYSGKLEIKALRFVSPMTKKTKSLLKRLLKKK